MHRGRRNQTNGRALGIMLKRPSSPALLAVWTASNHFHHLWCTARHEWLTGSLLQTTWGQNASAASFFILEVTESESEVI